MYQTTWRKLNPVYKVPIEFMKYKKESWFNKHYIVSILIIETILFIVAFLFPQGI